MKSFPKTIGFIMDGNRRWAERKNLPIITGHSKGARTLTKIVKSCASMGIEETTVFAFSTENWNRMPSEVNSIIDLIERYLRSEIARMNNNGIVFRLVGDKSPFKKSIIELFDYAENLTKRNVGMKFNVAINYGGKMDFLYAVRNILKKNSEAIVNKNEINEDFIRDNLISKNVSDIDLLIRSSGEQRISNFMFWQLAYSEIYFTETLWPDFTEFELKEAINFYINRERRYGANLFSSKNKS